MLPIYLIASCDAKVVFVIYENFPCCSLVRNARPNTMQPTANVSLFTMLMSHSSTHNADSVLMADSRLLPQLFDCPSPAPESSPF